MKSKIDTILLGLIAVILLVLCFGLTRPPAKSVVESNFFTWEPANLRHTNSDGKMVHSIVKFASFNFGEPDRFSTPWPVDCPADVARHLADDGWQFAGTDGKVWLFQRIGNPKDWKYKSFMVLSDQE